MIDTSQPDILRGGEHSDADAFVEPLLPAIGYAIDVGANDGLYCSNTLRFERKGWTVLCLEPNPELHEALAVNRKHFLRCAAGRQHGLQPFYRYGDYPYAAWSGFHPELAAANGVKDECLCRGVPVFTLTELLCASCFPRLDLLTIDTEGDELNVLAGLDFERWQPRIIIAEHLYGPDPTEFLARQGYQFRKRLRYDNIYQRSAPF